MNETIHERLIARQSTAELERKWEKAQGRHSNQFWTAEWIDLAKRRGKEMADFFARADGQSENGK